MTTEPALSAPDDFRRNRLAGRQYGLWRQAWQRLLRNRLAVVSAAILVVIVALSISADFVDAIQRHDPVAQDFDHTSEGPSGEHFLGTDNLGRDLWARLLQGTLFSLKVGLGGMVIVLAIGVTVGMAASIGSRRTGGLLMWFTDLAFAFPDLLAVILLRQVLIGRGWPVIGDGDPQIAGFPGTLLVTIVAVSFVSWVTIARLVRGQMLSIGEQEYVLAAQALGASSWRIVRVHMLPNTLGAIIVAATFGVPSLIFVEAALGFIGLGVAPPEASLGTLINDGMVRIRSNGWEIFWPVATIATLMLAFTFLGDGLRDALDPRTRR